jgi:NAD-dependent dihydropyrimidine dehydrogenase PreA subunit
MKNKIRIYIQFIFLALIGYVAIRPIFDKAYLADFERYCPFGGISSFFSKLNQDTMSCNMSETQLLLGLGLLLGAVFIGKLFCSYVCPIGTFTEWIGRLGDKLKIRREMPAKLDRYMRLLKYVLLFITLYVTMTTSELFCKEFDPYFASANLFSNNDIVLYFAIPAFIITIVGALFFRLFWCKYLCPLGAVTNIFMNVVGAGLVIIIFLAANFLGAHLSLVWLIGGLVLVGLVNELGFMKSFFLPVPKISRNENKCTDCGLCDDKCPQGIKISQTPVVNHVDCNLCTDCVYTCPLKNVLTVNKKKNLKYLAPVALVILIALSLTAASFYELTTISVKWGKPAGTIAMYKQSGLKNVKCYGSSMALKGTLENVEGIYGLDTYAKSHTVKIYYDPAVISEKKVKASLFTPAKTEVSKIKRNAGIDSVSVWEVGVYGLFDPIDFNNLFYALREKEGVYGFETHFGEPVMASVYYNSALISPFEIKNQIEKKVVLAKKLKGNEKIEMDFKAENEGVVKGKISLLDYNKRIFKNYDRLFNEYKKYKPEQLSVFKFPMPEAGVPSLRRFFGSLSSHLSADEGIVRLSTRYVDVPSGYIFFDPAKTKLELIKEALTKDKLTIFTSDTESKEIENPFHIKAEGTIYKPSDLNIDDEL